jgi:hypothetical protein
VRDSGAFGSLGTDQDIACEKRRQDLLDQRWRRWQSMIWTSTVVGATLSGAIPIGKALSALAAAVGLS